jgi:amino acid transporter
MSDAAFTEKDDVEKAAANGHSFDAEKGALPEYTNYDNENLRRGSVTTYHEGFFSAFSPSSFKRNPNARVVTEATDNEGRPLPDQPPAEPALAMKLKARHLQMIAIGGSIGTGTLKTETFRSSKNTIYCYSTLQFGNNN